MATAPLAFIGQVREEMKKVTYPSREEVVRLTVIVICVSLALAFFLGGLDFVFSKLIQLLLKVKIQ